MILGYLLEDLERKGLDAKSYIQTMLRRTEGSSKEEQIIQKEQILAELQRVEKELQVGPGVRVRVRVGVRVRVIVRVRVRMSSNITIIGC